MTEATPLRRVELAAGAVTAWSMGPLIVRGVGASTRTVVFWRLWFAQPIMINAAYLMRGRLSWRLLRTSLVPGVLFSASIITSFASFQYTSTANATLIGALQPAVMLFVAPRLFGDPAEREPASSPASPSSGWQRPDDGGGRGTSTSRSRRC